jgi:hypothetical protein
MTDKIISRLFARTSKDKNKKSPKGILNPPEAIAWTLSCNTFSYGTPEV